jgi:hypothetical protein
MEQNYVVIFKVHDSKSGAWANSVVAQYNDEWAAKSKYHSELARLLNAQDFDFVMVMLIDTYGNTKSEFRDSRMPETEIAE